MKMLFFSSEHLEVEQVFEELVRAGIPCEVREEVRVEHASPNASGAELWIQHDCDSHRAFMLCVRLGMGFAKRAEAA